MTPKVLDKRMPALLGLLFIAGCATGVTPSGDGTDGSSGAAGAGAAGAAGFVAMGVGGTAGVVTGSGGTVSASGGASVGKGGANVAGAAAAGGATSGAGGATGVGGAGTAGAASGTGGGAAGPCTVGTGTSTVTDTGGFVTAGTWHGYAFTAPVGVSTSITPAGYAMLTAGSALCACGTVKGTVAYSDSAMIGINLNQEAGGTTVGTITPSGAGVSVTVTGAGTTPLRLQIQGPMGDTDPTQRWCADLPAAGGMIPWGNFLFECWQGGHRTPFNGTAPIASVLVQVPGGTTDIPFNFCVTALAGG